MVIENSAVRYDITGELGDVKTVTCLQYLKNMRSQDGWFLLFISAIYAQLRLVGGIDFLNRYPFLILAFDKIKRPVNQIEVIAESFFVFFEKDGIFLDTVLTQKLPETTSQVSYLLL